MTTEELNAYIDQEIYENTEGAITGTVLNRVLKAVNEKEISDKQILMYTGDDIVGAYWFNLANNDQFVTRIATNMALVSSLITHPGFASELATKSTLATNLVLNTNFSIYLATNYIFGSYLANNGALISALGTIFETKTTPPVVTQH